MNRGFDLPLMCSALATTRRSWFHIPWSVLCANSTKIRAGCCVASKLLLGVCQRAIHELLQSLIPRYSNDIMHTIVLAPRQQFVRAESRIAAQDDLHLRPALANLVDDPLDFLPASHAWPDAARPQSRAQHRIAAEEVERQVAVVFVVAVIKLVFLVAVQR